MAARGPWPPGLPNKLLGRAACGRSPQQFRALRARRPPPPPPGPQRPSPAVGTGADKRPAKAGRCCHLGCSGLHGGGAAVPGPLRGPGTCPAAKGRGAGARSAPAAPPDGRTSSNKKAAKHGGNKNASKGADVCSCSPCHNLRIHPYLPAAGIGYSMSASWWPIR